MAEHLPRKQKVKGSIPLTGYFLYWIANIKTMPKTSRLSLHFIMVPALGVESQRGLALRVEGKRHAGAAFRLNLIQVVVNLPEHSILGLAIAWQGAPFHEGRRITPQEPGDHFAPSLVGIDDGVNHFVGFYVKGEVPALDWSKRSGTDRSSSCLLRQSSMRM